MPAVEGKLECHIHLSNIMQAMPEKKKYSFSGEKQPVVLQIFRRLTCIDF